MNNTSKLILKTKSAFQKFLIKNFELQKNFVA